MTRTPAGLLVALALFAAQPAHAQEPQTGFMVAQWLQCPPAAMDEVNRLAARLTPILEELEAEGMIRSWYDVRHAWGDEWNVGVVSVFDSHRAWLDFWDEYLRRIAAAAPDVFPRLTELCPLHKDNLYVIRDSREGGGP